jgi:hypothetical protein
MTDQQTWNIVLYGGGWLLSLLGTVWGTAWWLKSQLASGEISGLKERCEVLDQRRQLAEQSLFGIMLSLVDKKPTIRQLYQIAELGKAQGEPTRAPTFMRLTVTPDQPRIEGAGLDFRDEIMAQIYDPGDVRPKRVLTFNIQVTNDGETHGPPFRERRTFRDWRHIGTITFDRAVVSYNGDFVIHFRHPTWRDDQNDPATATRVNERKVR